MKVSGGIEFYIKITQKEFVQLDTKKLGGIFHFMEESPKVDRQIPFTFERSKRYTQEIIVKSMPNGYMGNAEKIKLTIDDSHYQRLKETSKTMDRFDDIGKVYIDVAEK